MQSYVDEWVFLPFKCIVLHFTIAFNLNGPVKKLIIVYFYRPGCVVQPYKDKDRESPSMTHHPDPRQPQKHPGMPLRDHLKRRPRPRHRR